MSSKSVPSRAQWLKRLALRRRDRVGFVLSGGGPLGAMQIGALKALLENDVTPELVVGSSVGSLNATFLAFNPTRSGVGQLEDIWRDLEENDLFPGGRFKAQWARMLVKGNRVFENSGIRRMIESRLGGARFEDAQIPLGVIATELETGKEELFTSGPILEPLLASSAMPGIYPPVEIEGRHFIDGGVSNNVPIAPAISMGANTIYVIDSTSYSHQKRPLTRPMDYLLHAFTLARAQRLAIEQTMYSEKVRLIMIPSPRIDFFVPFASLEHTEALMEASYDQTKAFLSGRIAAVVEETPEGRIEAISPAK